MTLVVARNNVGGRSTVLAVATFWAWTASKHVRRRTAVAALPTGGELSIPPWSQIGGYLLATGFTEVRDQHLVAALVRRGDVLVDVGANIGLYGVTAGVKGASVIAFEPTARAADIAEANLRRNGVAGEVRRAAVADWNGTASFSGGGVGAHLDPSGAVEVQVCRLDDLGLPVGALTLLKVDAEGHDLAVLRGACTWLAAAHPIVPVEIWGAGGEVQDLLAGLGYRFHGYDWRCGRLLPDPEQDSGNLLAVHPSTTELVRVRLTSARRSPGSGT